MLKIGITGQKGFVGQHLCNSIGLVPESYKLIDFHKNYFESEDQLDTFVSQCDVIVHLAAMNRHDNQQLIYNTNIRLVKELIASLKSQKETSEKDCKELAIEFQALKDENTKL